MKEVFQESCDGCENQCILRQHGEAIAALELDVAQNKDLVVVEEGWVGCSIGGKIIATDIEGNVIKRECHAKEPVMPRIIRPIKLAHAGSLFRLSESVAVSQLEGLPSLVGLPLPGTDLHYIEASQIR